MIDLRSDTVTTPSAAMRDAARDAEVGDDVYGEDPSVNALEAAAADLLGHDAALFCPSGTMANQVAVRTHTEPGQEVLVDRLAHVYNWEVGGLVEHGGLQPRPVEPAVDDDLPAGRAERGVPTPATVRDAYVEESVHRAGTGLCCLEDTHNARGGLAIEPERIDAAADAARELGLAVHLDGARLANAAVAHDVPVSRFTERVDTTMLSLSKGLGAPVGSVLAGDEATIERARRHRKLLGGAMRQAGVLAAPGQLALENVDRLAEDHERAARLAEGLAAVDGLDVRTPETNIVVADTGGLAETAFGAGDAATVRDRCAEADVGCTVMGEQLARFVTHRDVDDVDVEAAVERVRDVLAE